MSEPGNAKTSAENQPTFVHLHVHSAYSLLQGTIRVSSLVNHIKEDLGSSVALTDTNNLFGAIDFYLQAEKNGIKPILGCELSVLPVSDDFEDLRSANKKRKLSFQVVLLCKNIQGYQNLCKILTDSYQEVTPDDPKVAIKLETVEKYKEGLICLSGGLKSEISYHILHGEEERAIQVIQKFHQLFSNDYYLELGDSDIPEQEEVNRFLENYGKTNRIERVAACDAHYIDQKDAEAHEILQCIELGRNLDFERPKSLVPKSFRLKTQKEALKSFSSYPEAVKNTLKISDQCNVEFQFKDEKGNPIYHLPNFRPEGVSKEENFDTASYFRKKTLEGLEDHFKSPAFSKKVNDPSWSEKKKEYYDRLEIEMNMIEKTGFIGYFLIVSDFILWAKNNGIPVGPGRGSGAGSLVAYSLKITDIDPIEFNLLFERFINPERISMPDFDIDFCQDRRGEVISYVQRKYGAENVAQIITFGKLQARAVIKDVARVLGLSFAESDQITKLLPQELNINLKSAYEKEERLRDKLETDPKAAKVFDYALKLEGLYRNAGMHAAGVIITENPIVSYCPLFVGKDGTPVTQFDKDFSEKIGLIKFDFLGLKTLTVIDQAVKLIYDREDQKDPKTKFRLDAIPYDDPEVFKLISSGDTDGVFQLESSGMKDLCKRLQPSSLEDITAINAIYRPGPLGSGMVDEFIERKHGRKSIEYPHPWLEPILKETYGVILYQEQVMQIARDLAGYSLGQADILRRAMGKKKPEEMDKQREIFKKGAVEKGIKESLASSIFELMAKFAEYGFNKSHSAAYGVVSYQTAYLKRYFPAEFMASLMTTEMDNTEKLTKYIADSKSRGLEVLPPDVNVSQRKFSVGVSEKNEPAVRFGLEAIKGVGSAAVDEILEKRKERPFSSVLDFCTRVPTRKANKKVLESLICAGAFDSIAEVNRASLFASIEVVLTRASEIQAEKELGQVSLFDAFEEDQMKIMTPASGIFKEVEDWPISRKLILEKQVTGFYVSGHPMSSWQSICKSWLPFTVEKAKNLTRKQNGALAGLIVSMKEIKTKKGQRMAFGEVEDLEGKMEVVFFPDTYQNFEETIRRSLEEAEPVVIRGDFEVRDDLPKILASEVLWLKEIHQNKVQSVSIRICPEDLKVEQLRVLKQYLLSHPGKFPLKIEFVSPKYKTALEQKESILVSATPKFIEDVNKILGFDAVHLQSQGGT